MDFMTKILLVGTGGFLGAVFRYLISSLVARQTAGSGFPFGTLAVNVIGCLLIGLLAGLAESRQFISPEFRLLVFIGFLGGFTTFSTFGLEGFALLQDGQHLQFLIVTCSHLILGIGFVWLGWNVSRLI